MNLLNQMYDEIKRIQMVLLPSIGLNPTSFLLLVSSNTRAKIENIPTELNVVVVVSSHTMEHGATLQNTIADENNPHFLRT